jgi:hypothetical protein
VRTLALVLGLVYAEVRTLLMKGRVGAEGTWERVLADD